MVFKLDACLLVHDFSVRAQIFQSKNPQQRQTSKEVLAQGDFVVHSQVFYFPMKL